MERSTLDAAEAAAVVAAVARAAAGRDGGRFWRTAGVTPRPSSADAISDLVWACGLAALAVLLAVVVVRRRSWRDPEARVATLEMTALVATAFIVLPAGWVVAEVAG